MEWGIIFIILFTPLAMASVYPWAYGLMETIAFILMGWWLVKGVHTQSMGLRITFEGKKDRINWVWLWPCLFLLLVLFQVIPFPLWFIKIISPPTYRVYHPIFSGKFRTLSLDRFASWCELLKLLAYLCLFLILVYYPFHDHRRTLKRICLAAMFTGVIVGLLGLFQKFSNAEKIFWIWKPVVRKDNTFYGPFVNPNHFAVYMEMIISLFLGYIAYQLVKVVRARGKKGIKEWLVDMEDEFIKIGFFIFLMFISTVSLFFSLSRGGIVIILYALLFFIGMVYLRRKHARGPAILAFLFCFLIFLYLTYLGIEPILSELQTLSSVTQDASFLSRIKTWGQTCQIIKKFPVFGVGLGGFGAIFQRFGRWGLWWHAHNDYLQLWAELGAGGIILIAIGLFHFIRGIINWVRRGEDPNIRREAEHYLQLGCYTAIFCFIIHSLIGFSFYIPANMALFVIICGILIGIKGKQKPYQNKTVEKFSRFYSITLLAFVLFLIVGAMRGGYGQNIYESANDKSLQEKILKEIPNASIMPLWIHNPYRHYFLARLYEKKGFEEMETKNMWWERSAQEIKRALDLQPSRSLFWARLGYLLSYNKEEDAYILLSSSQRLGYRDAFAQALRFAPHDARLHYQIGSYLWKIDDPEGLFILQKAIKLNPGLRRFIERILRKP